MRVVSRYLQRNQDKIDQIFYSNCKDDELPATKIFSFLQQVFSISSISFIRDGKEFFKDDNNQTSTEQVIEHYYKTTPNGRSEKFYLYRINFEYAQILEFLEYWFNTDKSFTIHDPADTQENQLSPEPPQNKQQPSSQQIKLPSQLRQSAMLDNQFLKQEEKKPMLVAAYQGQIKKMEEVLLRSAQTGEETTEVESRIALLRNKIVELSRQTLKQHRSNSGSLSNGTSSLSPKKPKTQGSKDKKVNFKAIFDFYARQNHLTGAISSFDRIQHESQTINYQKLVYFLKQYDLFPEKARDQKRIHNLYVRTYSNTRDLFYPEFMEFLQKLPEIVIKVPQGSTESKKDLMMLKIQSKNDKNKVLHNPFHSLQKQNFRIDRQDIKYEFKLKPINGKLEYEMNLELQSRRKEKDDIKMQLSKEKEQKLVKKLKKLMAIDPYNPQVVKNAHLLKERSISVMQQPVANLDNMERFRDASFDMKAKFGISDFDQDPLKPVISNRYNIEKRIQILQREESLKMSNLMSGIIQRSEAKLVKLGLSPRKKHSKLP